MEEQLSPPATHIVKRTSWIIVCRRGLNNSFDPNCLLDCKQGASEAEAEDAVQEALLRLLNSLRNYSVEKLPPLREPQLFAWLVTVAQNYLLDEHRRNKSLISMNTQLTKLCDESEDLSERVGFCLMWEQAWQKLSSHDQYLLLLKADGHSCKEVARRYQLDVGIIEKRLQRCRTRFARHIQTAGIGEILRLPRIRRRDTSS